MRFRACATVLIFVAASAHAGTPTAIDIGGGVSITPEGNWTAKSMSNPAMKIPSIREFVNDASETRIKGSNTGVLVSYMNLKPGKDYKPVPLDDAFLQSKAKLTEMSAAQYLGSAQETEAKADSRIIGPLVVSLATLHAKQGAQFRVAPGYPGGCVTTGSIARGTEAWAISIASDDCEAASHKAAVIAMFAATAR